MKKLFPYFIGAIVGVIIGYLSAMMIYRNYIDRQFYIELIPEWNYANKTGRGDC